MPLGVLDDEDLYWNSFDKFEEEDDCECELCTRTCDCGCQDEDAPDGDIDW